MDEMVRKLANDLQSRISASDQSSAQKQQVLEDHCRQFQQTMLTADANLQQLRTANNTIMQENQVLRQENISAQDEILKVQHEDEAIRADAQAKRHESHAKQRTLIQEKEQVEASLAASLKQIDQLSLNQRTPTESQEIQAMVQQLALLKQPVDEKEKQVYAFIQ